MKYYIIEFTRNTTTNNLDQHFSCQIFCSCKKKLKYFLVCYCKNKISFGYELLIPIQISFMGKYIKYCDFSSKFKF